MSAMPWEKPSKLLKKLLDQFRCVIRNIKSKVIHRFVLNFPFVVHQFVLCSASWFQTNVCAKHKNRQLTNLVLNFSAHEIIPIMATATPFELEPTSFPMETPFPMFSKVRKRIPSQKAEKSSKTFNKSENQNCKNC